MTSSDRYCTQLSYHTTDHEHDECFPLHPPQLAIEKYTYKDARAENFEVLIIFDTIHVEDARNHVHHRRRDTARTATNDTSLESAQKVKKIYPRTSAIGAVVTPRDARKDENSRFLLFFSKSPVLFSILSCFSPEEIMFLENILLLLTLR